MKVLPRHVVAGFLGLALIVMPLLILSYDPNSKLERLRTPLCSPTIVVEATNQNGGSTLLTPDSGIKVNARVDGESYAVRFTLFVREPGQDWRADWVLDAPSGREIFYLAKTVPGEEAYVRALDPSGKACPGDSPILAAPSAT